jgi:hypothetical protein
MASLKTLLWLVAGAGAVAVAATIVRSVQRKQLLPPRLQLAGGLPYEIFEAEIIEIVPFDPPGAPMVDDTTVELLEELAHEGLFTKPRM